MQVYLPKIGARQLGKLTISIDNAGPRLKKKSKYLKVKLTCLWKVF